MHELVGSQSYCIYHGQQYIQKSFGKDRLSGVWYVRIPKPHDCVEDDFPDALEFGGSDDDGWIKLPVKALSRRWSEDIYGLWRGVKVQVTILHKRGQSIPYCYSSDPAAGERGLRGDQYQGWQGAVSADEVQLTYKEVWEYPIDPPDEVVRRGDKRVTRIPFDPVSDNEKEEDA